MSPNDSPKTGADEQTAGMRKGLTNYGDAGFSLFLRKAFIKGAGYTDSALDRPVVGIADTGSSYNPCHGNMPQLELESADVVTSAAYLSWRADSTSTQAWSERFSVFQRLVYEQIYPTA